MCKNIWTSSKQGAACTEFLNSTLLLLQIAVAKDCVLLRWAVLDWNTSAIDVYKQWGGQNMSEKEGWLFFLMHKQSMVDYLAKYTSIK